MADLTQDRTDVKLPASGSIIISQAGEALLPGQPIYSDATGKWFLCDATTIAKARCRGIALTPADVDGYFVNAQPGNTVNIGATLEVNKIYIVSANSGAIAPVDDLDDANFLTIIGIAHTTDSLVFNPRSSGVQKTPPTTTTTTTTTTS